VSGGREAVQRVYAYVYRGLDATDKPPSAVHLMHRDVRLALEGALELGKTPLVFAASGWAFRLLQALRDWDRLEQLSLT